MAQAAQNAPADPNSIYLQAAAQNEEAKAAKARADTILTVAKAEETQAKTAETLAGIDRDDREQVLKMAKAVQEAGTARP